MKSATAAIASGLYMLCAVGAYHAVHDTNACRREPMSPALNGLTSMFFGAVWPLAAVIVGFGETVLSADTIYSCGSKHAVPK